MKANPELRVIATLLAHQLRGGPVTGESLGECHEAVDDLIEFSTAWMEAKHDGHEVDERHVTFLNTAAASINP